MGATGELRSIKDRQGNTLTFQPNGIISSTGRSVSFQRDPQGRITKLLTPAFLGSQVGPVEYQYTYDPTGDLVNVNLPSDFEEINYGYEAHRLTLTRDPRGNPARTSTYYPDGRLETDTDATLTNVTTYVYNLSTRTTTTTFPDNGVLTEVFDLRGLVVSDTNPLGLTTTHVYDPDRNEVSRTNAFETMTAVYDHGNQVTRTDNLGTTHTKYNAFSLPTEFEDAFDHKTTIEYDKRGVPMRFADELGTRFKFINSEQGLPIAIDDAAEKRAYIEYDAAGNVTARTDWLGRTTRATYDEAGCLRDETSARGGKRTHAIDLLGRRKSTTERWKIDQLEILHEFTRDRNGNLTSELVAYSNYADPRKTLYTYDALNHLTQVQYEDFGPTVTYKRNFRGDPTEMTDELGRKTTYEYDKAGHLTKTTFLPDTPDTTFTTRTYDPIGRLASETDERNHTTTYGYQYVPVPGCDCSDLVTTVTDPLLRTTTTTNDSLGRKKSVTDANNHTTTFEYDVRGHLTDTHYPDGTGTHDEYDPRGRRIWTRDQMSQTTHYGYDDQGQLTSVTDPLANVTSYTYDADGNLASVTDANNHVTAYEYDLLKRKTKRTLPLNQFETFTHDPAGNVLSHRDFRGKTTTMVYDRRSHMERKEPDPSLGEAVHIYTYWDTGLRKTATNASGLTSYTYDDRNRLQTKATPAGTLTYTYDAAGNLATVRSSNTNGTSVDYTWDAANQLAAVTDNRAGGVTLATFSQTGRPSTVAQPNGIGVTYSYDNPLDRVTAMTWRQGTSPPFASWAYTHNQRGQRVSATDITGRSAAYGYDDAARLASETITADPRGASFNGALSYVLDGAGNRLSRTSTLAVIASATHTYDGNDQLVSDGYDPNGNTTSSGGDTFAYDFENRLASKNNGAITVLHDCDGNRVAKTVGGVTTQYLVDDLNPTGYLQVLEEVSGGGVQTRYTYGTKLVSQTRGASGTPSTSYYGYDAHGNITFLTDAIGSVTDSYDYDAWGMLVASTGSTPNKRLYAGEEFDPDLGLINLRARQYRSGTGRFLTLDRVMGRLDVPLSFNRYLYAHADAANLLDPSGLNLEYTGTLTIPGGLVVGETIVIGTATKVAVTTTLAATLGVSIACAVVKGSGISNKALLTAAISDSNPLLVALSFCAQKPCTLVEGDRPDLCQYDCHEGGPYWSIPLQSKCPKELTKDEILGWGL
jgi:RHS repeat-associated protein